MLLSVLVTRGEDRGYRREAGARWAEVARIQQDAGDGGAAEAEDGSPDPGEGTGTAYAAGDTL